MIKLQIYVIVVTGEMLKYESVLLNMFVKIASVSDDWKNAIIVPLHKGIENKNECKTYIGISVLSVPGKVFGTVLIERIQVVAMREKKSGKCSVALC